jgi:multidrug resistance efflux pump
LESAQATLTAATLQVQRLRRLHTDGIVSRRDLEVAERDDLIARRSVDSAQASVTSAQSDVLAAEAEVGRTKADAQARIDSASATANKARGELEDTRGSLAKIEVDLARQRAQIVNAPRDGTVFRLFGNPEGKVVKQGDPLLVVVPDTLQRSVELWVDGNDVPLITPGRHVRLQFEGWPAVQFVGWPSVAVGTFGGTVAFVDATDDGKGKFRVMVVPDDAGQPWPTAQFLRQGVRVRGWVLLDQVRLGWEVWRQLNGFPPVIKMEGTQEDKPKDVAKKRLK